MLSFKPTFSLSSFTLIKRLFSSSSLSAIRTRSDRVPDELWTEVHDIVQETGSRPSPWKRNAKKQNGCLRRPYNSCEKKRSEKQRRKGKIYPFEYRVSRIACREKKAFHSDQCNEIEENNRMGKTRGPSRKLEIPREHFIQRWA